METTADQYTIVQDHSHKTSSCVWKYFGSLKKNDELVDVKHVYCTKCFDMAKTKKYQKSTSTGNLIKHLKRAHYITDQPSYRVKQEKNRTIVTKEDSSYFEDDEVDANDYYCECECVIIFWASAKIIFLFFILRSHRSEWCDGHQFYPSFGEQHGRCNVNAKARDQ